MLQGIQDSKVRYIPLHLGRMARRVNNFLILFGIPRGVVMGGRVIIGSI
jgi:hypothetical protein